MERPESPARSARTRAGSVAGGSRTGTPGTPGTPGSGRRRRRRTETPETFSSGAASSFNYRMTMPPGQPRQAWSALPDLSPKRLQPLVTRHKAKNPEANMFTDTSPRMLTSILHNFMQDNDDGTTTIRNELDLVAHAIESGRPVTNATVQEACRMNPNLVKLDITGCTEVTDVGIWAVARQCTGLTDLRIGGCDQITYIGLRSLALCCRGLRSLDFFESAAMNDLGLRVIGSGCWELRYLNLEGCMGITDTGLAEIAQCCTNLTALNVSRCERLGEFGDIALRALGRSCKDLLELDMFGCKHVRDPGLKAVALGCRKLQKLRLTGCREISGDALRCLAVGCSGLTDLSVAGCEKLRSADLQTLCSSCTSLTALNIEKCVEIETPGVRSIVRHCPQLHELNLTGCVKIKDDSADLIARHCYSLRSLNLSECPRISELGVKRLVDGCTALAYLNLTGCEKISRKFLQGVVRDLMFSEWANEYFGYQPKPNADELRVQQEIFQTETHAATEIQRVWRGCKSRGGLHAIRLRFVEKVFLPRMQANVRGFLQRSKYGAQREKLARHKASCRVQAWWRGRLGHAHYLRVWHVREMHHQQTRAAVLVQRIFRGHRQRGAYEVVQEGIRAERLRQRKIEELRHNTIVHIQRVWRGRGGRRQAATLFELREEMRRQQALERRTVLTLQRVFRGHQGRTAAQNRREELVRMREEQTAALRLQALVRGHQGRLNARIRKLAKDKELREAAAVTLQNFWRYVRARHVSSMLRALNLLRATEAVAVVKIQALTRGVLERKRIAADKANAIIEQRRRLAAGDIQRVFRGHKGREEFEVQVALAKLQELAKPLFLQLEHLGAELQAAEKASQECEAALLPIEADVKMLSEELEECLAIRTKYHDSARITGAPQRYLTKFLQLNLAEQLKEGRDAVRVEQDRLVDLKQLVRGLEKRLRQAERELEPLTLGKRTKTTRERSMRLRREARVNLREHNAARHIQRCFRGYRTRVVVAIGANYWEQMLDEESGKPFYLNLRSQQVRWIEPIDIEIWGETKMSRSWIECTDSEGLVYFFNVDTKEKRYEKPDGFDGLDTEQLEEEAAAAASAAALQADEDEWERRVDPDSGAVYFISRVSGDIKWEDDGEETEEAKAEREAAEAAAEAEAVKIANDRQHAADKWHQKVDADTGAAYWMQEDTGDIAWSPRRDEGEGAQELQRKIELLDEDDVREDYADHPMHQEWLAAALAGGRLVTAEVIVDEMLERMAKVKAARAVSLAEAYERDTMLKEDLLSRAVEQAVRAEEERQRQAAADAERKRRRKKKAASKAKSARSGGGGGSGKKKKGVPEPRGGKKKKGGKKKPGSGGGTGGDAGLGEVTPAAAPPVQLSDDDDELTEDQIAEQKAQQRKREIAKAKADARAAAAAEVEAAEDGKAAEQAEAEELAAAESARSTGRMTESARLAKEAEEILAEVGLEPADVPAPQGELGEVPAAAAEALPLEPPWQELQDDEGNVYYLNSETNETSWARPGEQQALVVADGEAPVEGADYDAQYYSSDYYEEGSYEEYDAIMPEGEEAAEEEDLYDPYAEDGDGVAAEDSYHSAFSEVEGEEEAPAEELGYYDENGVYYNADGSVSEAQGYYTEDGSYVNPDGSFYASDGSLYNPDGSLAAASVHEEGSTYSEHAYYDTGGEEPSVAGTEGAESDGSAKVEWVEYWDESAGAAYYFNPETQEASWTVPTNSIIVSSEEYAARFE